IACESSCPFQNGTQPLAGLQCEVTRSLNLAFEEHDIRWTHLTTHDDLIHSLEWEITALVVFKQCFRAERDNFCLISKRIGPHYFGTVPIRIDCQLLRLEQITDAHPRLEFIRTWILDGTCQGNHVRHLRR